MHLFNASTSIPWQVIDYYISFSHMFLLGRICEVSKSITILVMYIGILYAVYIRTHYKYNITLYKIVFTILFAYVCFHKLLQVVLQVN